MSWSIRVRGTAEEIRAAVHKHEAEHWRHMPLSERLAVHHLVGHAVECAVEDSQRHDDPVRRFILIGNGTENGGEVRHTIELGPLPEVKDSA